jgi:putative transcriptional regulator
MQKPIIRDLTPTLQGWEQGRKQPSGAARTLLTIARTNPKALLAVAGK